MNKTRYSQDSMRQVDKWVCSLRCDVKQHVHTSKADREWSRDDFHHAKPLLQAPLQTMQNLVSYRTAAEDLAAIGTENHDGSDNERP